ncbi:MAG: ATP-binding cassette domain-containing protein [Erysipelotrichaceae bacterium]|nr:ATP-binding cassette domain-containing protein [Erysipelotrichaceae bacterium]
MIEIKNLSKAYKGNVLFEDLNLIIPDGEKVLIKGPNGSGKSVLMKMIVGYSKPDVGEVVIDGSVIGKDTDFIKNAGISINAPEFMKDMSGIDNLMYLININKNATKDDIYKLAEKLDIKKDLNKKYRNYSLGMKQKLRIIQALVENPKYLILDEPFDALDKTSQKKLRALLEEFIDGTKTLIFTTHNVEFEDIADKIYEIDNHGLLVPESN